MSERGFPPSESPLLYQKTARKGAFILAGRGTWVLQECSVLASRHPLRMQNTPFKSPCQSRSIRTTASMSSTATQLCLPAVPLPSWYSRHPREHQGPRSSWRTALDSVVLADAYQLSPASRGVGSKVANLHVKGPGWRHFNGEDPADSAKTQLFSTNRSNPPAAPQGNRYEQY
jgi:hypothetical protein